jgi:hypothetical protein
MSKGSKRRPSQVSDVEYAKRWAMAFGKDVEDLGTDEITKALKRIGIVPKSKSRKRSKGA